MAFHQDFLFDKIATHTFITSVVFGAMIVYAVSSFYIIIHSSKFPGPPIAAVSNVWYAYHWLSGRYPWAVERALRKYGDRVRIAPNELVFVTPQATFDIYISHEKNHELFKKTDFQNRGTDLAADLSWDEKMHEMRDMKNSVYLDVLLGFNLFSTVIQVFKRFPLLDMFQYLFVPFNKLKTFVNIERHTRSKINQRIEMNGHTEHPDFFDFILPAGTPRPTNPREATHLGSVSMQLMFAAFGPMSDWFYATIFFLLEEPICYKHLIEEVRNAFKTYADIVPRSLTSLAYLNACLAESLRVHPSNDSGLPRFSPGALIDGEFIPKGSRVQTSIFALSRSPRYFHDPLHYRPQRWLSSNHPLYEDKFAKDALEHLFSFSLGPRACIGRDMTWMQARLFMAKLLWTFDVIRVPGQQIDLERSLLHYGFLIKPELKVRFVPVRKDETR
ncbi:cytochrome P450 [Mollisia scopiformis]|uniref:Cytochrome P450 n=1 Tax=Mollisia scopiformis TaxID=149040 RepID=A0A194WZR7_MOLSC|nr:cytochrome P450 [Mollisia scopiformis]KUJ13112.1 cytochrome P450 [Mollisia scopiformis]